jgi:hypothetical protein
MPDQLKPICFMVTPFGVKETQLSGVAGPGKVDFDQVWLKLFQPLIIDLGYEPVRADAELGASIIRDMLERLALSDLVIADISVHNVNVFYEVGVRHAARDTGCVLVAASWSRQPFDTQSMRYEPYELKGEVISDDEAARNRARLAPRIKLLAESKTPCFELEGFPRLPLERANTFRTWLRKMNAFNAKVTSLRLQPKSDARKAAALQLVADNPADGSPIVAYELLKLLRDTTDSPTVIAFIDSLPDALREQPLFTEQRALAGSKDGDHFTAIGALLQLIEQSGPSSERHGLIGGRYKKLWRTTRGSQPPDLATGYLDQAIDAYEAGRVLDLNNYYASGNLPLLLRWRGGDGDAARAARIAVSVVAACERAIQLEIADEWVYPTLLVAAFNAEDVAKAKELTQRVLAAPADWKLDSALDDLTDSVNLLPEGPVRAELATLLDRLRAAVAKRS